MSEGGGDIAASASLSRRKQFGADDPHCVEGDGWRCCADSGPPGATLEEDSASQAQDRCGPPEGSLSISAIRLSSGSDRAFIFRIKWLRCTFTVDSVMPISAAICLFRRPAVTWIMTSRSRVLSESKRSLSNP